MPLYRIREEAEEDRQLAKTLTIINESKPVNEEDVHRAREEYGSPLTHQLFAKQVSTRFGIVSFTKSPYLPLMWSHYTTDGSGFVIGYDVAQLLQLTGAKGSLKEVVYSDNLPPIIDPAILTYPESKIPPPLSVKSANWAHEEEWRLIVDLYTTIGTGQTDQHGQPINLIQVPNKAVVSVHYTERTPRESVKLVRDRLADENNRYRAGEPCKLILSSTTYGYEEALADS